MQPWHWNPSPARRWKMLSRRPSYWPAMRHYGANAPSAAGGLGMPSGYRGLLARDRVGGWGRRGVERTRCGLARFSAGETLRQPQRRYPA